MSYFDDPYDEDNQALEEDSSCDYGVEICEDPQAKAMGICTTSCSLYRDMVKAQYEDLNYATEAWHKRVALSNFYFWLLLVGITELLLIFFIWWQGWEVVQEGLELTSAVPLMGGLFLLFGLFVLGDLVWSYWLRRHEK